MATRTPYPGTILAADLLTASNNNKLPGGLIAYAGTATPIAGMTDDVDLGLTVSVTPVNGSRSLWIYASIPLFCEVPHLPGYAASSAADFVDFAGVNLHRDGATVSGDASQFDTSHTRLVTPSYLDIAPSATSHTYSLVFNAIFGIATYRMNASGALQAYIAVFDMGPSF